MEERIRVFNAQLFTLDTNYRPPRGVLHKGVVTFTAGKSLLLVLWSWTNVASLAP